MDNNQDQENFKNIDYQKVPNMDSIKPYKNINSLININNFNQIEQERVIQTIQSKRKTETQKIQMRQTWKKPRMPHNNKLPSAFIQLKKKPISKPSGNDMIKNIDIIVENYEYKQVNRLLSPIKLTQEYVANQKKKQNQQKKFRESKNQSNNPFLPVRQYIKIANQFNQKLKMQDLTIQKFKPMRTYMATPAFKLEQFVTLQVIKRTQNTGIIKKMLHVPSLKIYTMKQQPVNKKQSRNLIYQWLTQWQSKIYPSGNELGPMNPFVKLYTTFRNSPEGFVSILTQYCQGGSLQNLVQSVGTLPENVIKEIAVYFLKSLDFFYTQTQSSFGGVSPSQILFTEKGDIKLSMGLYYRINNLNAIDIFHTKITNKSNLLQVNNANVILSKWTPQKHQLLSNLEFQKSMDIFRFGFIMLYCALGSFQVYEQSAIIMQNVKFLVSEQGQKIVEKQNLCCLLHSQEFLFQFSIEEKSSKKERESSKIFKYMVFLKNRFSTSFINFLCVCLKLSNKRRGRINQLQQTNFLINPSDPKSIKIHLLDLLKISRGYFQESISPEILNKKIDRLIDAINLVLPNCRRDTISDLKNIEKIKIFKIAKEVGVNFEILLKRFENFIKEIILKEDY